MRYLDREGKIHIVLFNRIEGRAWFKDDGRELTDGEMERFRRQLMLRSVRESKTSVSDRITIYSPDNGDELYEIRVEAEKIKGEWEILSFEVLHNELVEWENDNNMPSFVKTQIIAHFEGLE